MIIFFNKCNNIKLYNINMIDIIINIKKTYIINIIEQRQSESIKINKQ